MARQLESQRWVSIGELLGTDPPTADDVCIAIDGERLDTPDKVRSFVERINRERDRADPTQH